MATTTHPPAAVPAAAWRWPARSPRSTTAPSRSSTPGSAASSSIRDAFGTFSLDQRFDVEGYLDYHGKKLVGRFDANSYLRLNKAMDLHDLVRGRGSLHQAIGRISAPSLVMSIRSDVLYPPYQQEAFRDALAAFGRRVGFYEIDSDDGHDGFLLEANQISPLVAAFLDSIDDLESQR